MSKLRKAMIASVTIASIGAFAPQAASARGGFGGHGGFGGGGFHGGVGGFHGGGWEYLRNDWFNANYFFNNDAGIPRQRQHLNQFGGKLGGPLWKDKAFFFVDMDNYLSPQSRSFTRDILSQDAFNGLFTYATDPTQPAPANNAWTTCVPSSARAGGGPACTVNLQKFAANNFIT